MTFLPKIFSGSNPRSKPAIFFSSGTFFFADCDLSMGTGLEPFRFLSSLPLFEKTKKNNRLLNVFRNDAHTNLLTLVNLYEKWNDLLFYQDVSFENYWLLSMKNWNMFYNQLVLHIWISIVKKMVNITNNTRVM